MIRWGVGTAVALVASLVGAAPASALWSGSLARATGDDGSSGKLVLTLDNPNPSYGFNLGLNLPGYTVSGVSSGLPGDGGRPEACGPDPQNGWTHNWGIDCSFQDLQTHVTVTFTTSPRYPDNGGAEVYDQGDGHAGSDGLSGIGGPAPAGSPPQESPPPNPFGTKHDAHAEAVKLAKHILICRSDREIASHYIYTPAGFWAYTVLVNSDCEKLARELEFAARVARDPVDQNFSAVALPSSPSTGTLGGDPCRKVKRRLRAACRSLSAAAARQAGALARSAALWGAIYTTLNRFNTAKQDGSDVGQQTQGAALEAYDGELIAAAASEDAADLAVARDLVKLHVRLKLPAKQVAAQLRAIAAGHSPAPLARALRAVGIGKKDFGNALKDALGTHPGAFDLISLLKTKSLTPAAQAGLESQLKLLTPQSLPLIVNGLTIAGAIDQAANQQLNGDVNKIQQAPDAASRAVAVRMFIDDAQGVQGGAATLLVTAGQALL